MDSKLRCIGDVAASYRVSEVLDPLPEWRRQRPPGLFSTKQIALLRFGYDGDVKVRRREVSCKTCDRHAWPVSRCDEGSGC